MSAAYHPYKDEEEDSCENLDSEHLNWADNQRGNIQIYEKTTEELPFGSNKRMILVALGICLLSILLGFLIGYFAHSSHSDCDHGLSVALHSVRDENLSVIRKIRENISAQRIRDFVRDISRSPRVAGTHSNRRVARQIGTLFREYGLDKVELKNYSVLLSLPDEQKPNFVEIVDVSMQQAVVFNSKDREPRRYTRDDLPPYCAYSPPGDVTGNIVFVNYGRMEDYHLLRDEYKIRISGKIVIAKQLYLSADEQWLNAQEMNASALLLYPEDEKRDDQSDFRRWSAERIPSDAIRRDSLLWNGIGDPQTPGYPSTEYMFRLDPKSLNLPRIPVQPISPQTAFELLGRLGGMVAPTKWQGSFNFTYKLGPGFSNHSLRARLKVSNRLVRKQIQNVIGYLRGSVEPDRYVLVGNHRDSWVNGALDAAGGTAALLELARVYGDLLRAQGWRPRRTIMFCSWGAEEFNLMGSTEWVEESVKLLHSRAVAYVSADILVTGNGSLSVAASPLLYHALYNATKLVDNPDPRGHHDRTVYSRWLASFPQMRNSSELLFASRSLRQTFAQSEMSYDYDPSILGHSEEYQDYDRVDPPQKDILRNYMSSVLVQVRPKVRPLDMRSVYAPFFTLVGVPVVEVNYVPTRNSRREGRAYPLIHTQYEDFHLVQSIDRGFVYHRAVTQVLGEVIRDLADSMYLPFNVLHYAQVLKSMYQQLTNYNLQQQIDLAILHSAIHNFTNAAIQFHRKQDKVDLRDPMTIRRINDQLLLLERAFLDGNGLPHNPLKKHVVFSPSETNVGGDSGQMFPGLMDMLARLVSPGPDRHGNPSLIRSGSWDIIKAHYSVIVFSIQSAANVLADVA